MQKLPNEDSDDLQQSLRQLVPNAQTLSVEETFYEAGRQAALQSRPQPQMQQRILARDAGRFAIGLLCGVACTIGPALLWPAASFDPVPEVVVVPAAPVNVEANQSQPEVVRRSAPANATETATLNRNSAAQWNPEVSLDDSDVAISGLDVFRVPANVAGSHSFRIDQEVHVAGSSASLRLPGHATGSSPEHDHPLRSFSPNHPLLKEFL